jgi:hypothetical protein
MILITNTDLDGAVSESNIRDVFDIPKVRTEEINKFILLLKYFFRMFYGINQHMIELFLSFAVIFTSTVHLRAHSDTLVVF